jgi:pyruvate,orthophosphate dikinase
MNKGIYSFSSGERAPKVSPELLGVLGRETLVLAEMGLPILPGLLLDSHRAGDIQAGGVLRALGSLQAQWKRLLGRAWGDPEHPLFLDLICSPSLAGAVYPRVQNLGLTRSVLTGPAGSPSEDRVRDIIALISGLLQVRKRIGELEDSAPPGGEPRQGGEARRAFSPEALMDEYAGFFPAGFFDDPQVQLRFGLAELSRLLQGDPQNDRDTALLILPVFPAAPDSLRGEWTSRSPVTGEGKLQGRFSSGREEQDIAGLDRKYRRELERAARAVEDQFQEIRGGSFIVEKGSLFLTGQHRVEETTLRAELKLLLDLNRRKILDDASLIQAIRPQRLQEILHPVFDRPSLRGIPAWKGGIGGSPGAALGRVWFSTRALLEARREALRRGNEFRGILALSGVFAEDVQAVEVCSGVLSAEGSYAAHSAVIARQFGKPALLAPGLRFRGRRAFLGDLHFAEGDWISLKVPPQGEGEVFAGAGTLIEPDPKESGILEFLARARGLLRGFQIRANADTPEEAERAFAFGAEGIGLCRTEHLFLQDRRINGFRAFLLASSPRERQRALDRLQAFQREDFSRLFQVCGGKPVTIRLLDSPLHEFMPHTKEEMEGLIAYMGKAGKLPRREVLDRVEALREFNPMLGRRGCRIAVLYPEIYAMQVRAILDARNSIGSKNRGSPLEILIPLVMNSREFRLIAYGKKVEGRTYPGLVDTADRWREEHPKAKTGDFRIGAMIELPGAALAGGDIARYAGFFSFGANDLTQTALGLSRDDTGSFLPEYRFYGLLPGDPFSLLDPAVKELIRLAVERGRLTRPDLVCGLCGEQGANPANMRFCIEAGRDYVSCSPYAVPIALLAAAQARMNRT